MSSVHKPVIITDEKGQKIGEADSPVTALKNGEIRLVSRVMIKSSKSQYLLQKRSEEMLNYPGYWDNSAAGHVDVGDTPEEAAYRELAEEVGITDLKLEKFAEYYSEYPQPDLPVSKTYNHLYTGRSDISQDEIAFDDYEVSEVRWFTLEEIDSLIEQGMATDGLQTAIEKLKK